MNRAHYLVLAALLLVLGVAFHAFAGAPTRPRLLDRGVASIHSETTWVDVSAADYTSYQVLATIAPENGHALYDTSIVLDLDYATGDSRGFAGGYTSETVTFAIGRKVQGNWRIDDQVESAAVTASAADARSVTLDAGICGPNESLRVYVKLSAESGDILIPYVVHYRAGASATITNVSN